MLTTYDGIAGAGAPGAGRLGTPGAGRLGIDGCRGCCMGVALPGRLGSGGGGARPGLGEDGRLN